MLEQYSDVPFKFRTLQREVWLALELPHSKYELANVFLLIGWGCEEKCES